MKLSVNTTKKKHWCEEFCGNCSFVALLELLPVLSLGQGGELSIKYTTQSRRKQLQ